MFNKRTRLRLISAILVVVMAVVLFPIVGASAASSIKLTIKNTSGATIATIEKNYGDIIDLHTISGLDYMSEEGKFLTFVDSSKKLHSASGYEVKRTTTLTATYQNVYGFYSGSDLASLPTDKINLVGFTASKVVRDNETYFRVTQTSTNSNVFSIYFPKGYTFKPTADTITVIDGSTDYQAIGRTFLQYFYEFHNDAAKTDTTCEYLSNIVKLGDDGRYHLNNVFTLTNFLKQNKTDVYGYRFAPFGGYGTGEAKYTFDIKYIATFDNEQYAKVFDYAKYSYAYARSKIVYVDFNATAEEESDDIGFGYLTKYLPNWQSHINRAAEHKKATNKKEFIATLNSFAPYKLTAKGLKEIFDMHNARYYKPSRQPEAYDIRYGFANYRTMDSDAIISELYEPLRLAHPDNITRENIGKDDSGKYDMWCYIFTPDNFDPNSDEYYTVFISAGSHGMNEAQSYLGLARLMQLIWDDKKFDEDLSILREKVRFITIPIVNVWDVSERVHGAETTYSPYNSNNVNLNRDWLTATPQQEVANIKVILNRYKDQIDFGYDFHTDPEGFPGWGSYLLVYPNGVYDFFSDRLKEVCAYLDYKNFDGKGIVIKNAFRGDNLNYPQGSKWDVDANPNYARQQNVSTGSAVMWSEFGFPSATLEHGSRKFGDRVFCGSDDMTAAIELYANQILQQLNYNFKEKVAAAKAAGN